jgi:vancomycin resistance protein VanW
MNRYRSLLNTIVSSAVILSAVIARGSCHCAAMTDLRISPPAVPATVKDIGEENRPDTVSGPESEMPWSNESAFLEAAEKNNTKIMLGGFKTVLKDPLPGEEYNVHIAADMLAGIVVKNGEVFSQNSAIGPYTKERGFREGPTYIGTLLTTTIGGGVCKVASTLYNTAVLSDMKIIERHNHTMPVPYVPYGQDATVSYGNKDIRFQNNTGSDIMIWARGIDNVLYMAFYGSKPAPSVEWKHQVLQTTKAPFMYKINPQMGANEKRLLVEGMDGAVVKSWVTVNSAGSSEIRYMGMSRYLPMPYLIEKGPDR